MVGKLACHLSKYFFVEEVMKYICRCPKEYGFNGRKDVCIHGWAVAHTVSVLEAQLTDRMVNAGIIKGAAQVFEEVEEVE